MAVSGEVLMNFWCRICYTRWLSAYGAILARQLAELLVEEGCTTPIGAPRSSFDW
jgi:hypothetical protein